MDFLKFLKKVLTNDMEMNIMIFEVTRCDW